MVVFQSVRRQFWRQPSFVSIHILSATVSASATTISERWWLQRQAKVKKPSNQLEKGGRGYLCSRGRGWERGASRQQRARRGSVWTRVLPARRPASHWRQPQLILGAPRQPSSCPATCSWVWIARLLLQTPPSPSPLLQPAASGAWGEWLQPSLRRPALGRHHPHDLYQEGQSVRRQCHIKVESVFCTTRVLSVTCRGISSTKIGSNEKMHSTFVLCFNCSAWCTCLHLLFMLIVLNFGKMASPCQKGYR